MTRTVSVTAIAALTLSSAANAQLRITEVHPSGSGSTPYAADWFEITNTGNASIDISGYRFDDNSNLFGSSVALLGVVTIPAGASAVFLETTSPATLTTFLNTWFSSVANAPAGYLLGSYSGSGVGLSTGGDAVNLFDSGGARVTGVQFGAATTNVTFDNAAGVGGTTLPLPTISQLSVAGVNGAFSAAGSVEIGSPFAVPTPGVAALLSLGGLIATRRRRAH